MSGPQEAAGNEVTARFLFPPDFVGFRGHFPDRPLLPAVCKIQAAMVMLSAWSDARVELREIVSAKFLKPVTAGEELLVRCRVTMAEDGRGTVTASAAREGEDVARFKLRVTFEQEGRGFS
jgi:3-hydroxyacyl-[acyl-carrier-protein] dehydratase